MFPRCLSRPAAPALLALLFLMLTGCGVDDDAAAPNTGAGTADPPRNDERRVVQEILDRYAQCREYSDVANIKLRYELNGRRVEEDASIAVNFRRPNQLNLKVTRGINILRLVSDGNSTWTVIEDEATENLRNQVVQLATPEKLTMGQVYAATELVDPANPNEAVSALFGMPLSLELSQLGLLLDGLAFRQLLRDATAVERLGNAKIGNVMCRRYQISSSGGNYVFWWNLDRRALMRIEYPKGMLFDQPPEGSYSTDFVFQTTFADVSFAALDDSDFLFQPGEKAIFVRFFVLPPQTLATEKLDQIIPAFSFLTLDGQRESSKDWQGQLKVLTWFNDHETSRTTLPQIRRVQQDLATHEQPIVWRAVCAEPGESLSNDRLRQLISAWNLDLPVVRDVDAVGRDLFEISEAPTTVVLDAEGRLHFFDVGANPQLSQTLADVVRRTMAGQSVGADLLRRDFAEREAFEMQLAVARIAAPSGGTPVSEKLPPASMPNKLSLRELWRHDKIASAGNLTMFHDSNDALRIAVLSGRSDLIILDAGGDEVTRKTLDVDQAFGISRLRAATDGNGQTLFVGLLQMGGQVYVFDRDFGRLFQYPDQDQRYAKILDGQLADLDEDGELELYVGFADPLGVHRVDLQGKRAWGNRASPSVVSLAPRWLAKPPYLLTTSGDGRIRPVSQLGREGQPIGIANRTIHQLAAANTKDARPTQFLGISFTLEGRLIAVGLDQHLHEAWSYGLPHGTFRSQVETPVSAVLLSDDSRQWICAGPDGSIHVIDDDGSFFDFFHTGHSVRGVAAFRDGDRGVLVVSGPDGVSAWHVHRPSG